MGWWEAHNNIFALMYACFFSSCFVCGVADLHFSCTSLLWDVGGCFLCILYTTLIRVLEVCPTFFNTIKKMFGQMQFCLCRKWLKIILSSVWLVIPQKPRISHHYVEADLMLCLCKLRAVTGWENLSGCMETGLYLPYIKCVQDANKYC